MGIGAKIKAFRTAKGMSLQELSDLAGGLSKGYLYRLEQDDPENPPNPSLAILTKIANALEVSVSELTSGESSEKLDQEWEEDLNDPNLRLYFRELKQLSEKDREIALRHLRMLKEMEKERKKKKEE